MIRPTKYIMAAALVAAGLSSCNDYLDKLPDDRAELDTSEKIVLMLVSAYPECSSNEIMEISSDNVTDNGKTYSTSVLCDELYRFEDVDVTTGSNDSPYQLWNSCYGAVATANDALEAIDALGNPSDLDAATAEAKICRAYAMFQMANVFCMAYNPDKADEYLGLPYPEETGLELTERGTLAELFAKINQDIEDALPYISDDYTTPKYHFNTKAAYAFAARFNVYYMNYDKAIEYATKALGENPADALRDYSLITSCAGAPDMMNQYISSSEAANLLLVTAYSLSAYYPGYLEGNMRFQHNQNMCYYETVWAEMPWGGSSSSNPLYYSNMVYGTSYFCYVPKISYLFEYTDKINQIGYAHIVDPVFTADETILYRAEAYALTGQYQKAVDDMNYWLVSHSADEKDGTARPTLTIESINEFVEKLDYAILDLESNRDRSPRKTFNPQGFTVNSGTQENLLQIVLHMRRLEMIGQGTRFMDIKRYGIEYIHPLSGEDPAFFSAGDLRGAIQIPTDVVEAGVASNPRPTTLPTVPATVESEE